MNRSASGSVFIAFVTALTHRLTCSRVLMRRMLSISLLVGIILNFGWLPSALAATDCAAVTEIPQAECEALIALYNSTDGPNWTDSATSKWNTDNLPSAWTGLAITDGHVIYVSMPSNNLSGVIPPELGNLTDLQYLWLNNNQLSGSVPPELGNLTNLQYLTLDFNQLSGSVPPELGNLTNLKNLWLNNNQLSGPVPPELGNLANVEQIGLYNNQLSGSVPPELENLTNLQSLHLQSNQLSGSVPPELGNLTNLRQITLSFNQLSGSVPPELGNLTNLQNLHLHSNQLSGSVPPELGNLANLRQISLSSNRLSGAVPPELGNLTNLQNLYLYSNQLSGSVPPELRNLTDLQDLWLGHNKLTASDPELLAFLSAKAPDWADTQTVPPTNVAAAALADRVRISWSPVIYTSDGGYYRIRYGNSAGGPYTSEATTADKYAASYDITGLSSGDYYFVVETHTPVHDDQQNNLTSYPSSEVSATFTKPVTHPKVITKNTVTFPYPDTALVNGEVESVGGTPVTERGFCWNTSGFPSLPDHGGTGKCIQAGQGTGTFSASVTGLIPGTTCYVRAYAVNTRGTAYGSQVEIPVPSCTQAVLSLTPSYLDIPGTGGNTELHVENAGNCPMGWTVAFNADWLSADPVSGTDSNIITVSYESNTGRERTGTIIISAPGAAESPGIVRVRQACLPAVLSVEPSSASLPETGGKTVFNITGANRCPFFWRASENADWFSVTPRYGAGSGTVTVTYESNAGRERTGLITVTAEGASESPRTLHVRQAATSRPVVWTKMTSSSSENLNSVWGSSGNNVFAVGARGTIIRYDGNTWTEMASGTPHRLRAVWGSSGNNVFAAGDNGLILRYDGNESGIWTEMTTHTSGKLLSIWGSSESDVFASVADGGILHYDGNAENIWTGMPVVSPDSLRGLWVSPEQDVFGVGGKWNSVTMLRYHDNTPDIWTEKDISVMKSPYAVWGTSGNNVFAVGSSGLILRYAGSAWEETESGTSACLRGIWGSSGNNVFAVGVKGTILYYDGTSWKKTPTGISTDLCGVWGSSEDDVFVVGRRGMILRYSPTVVAEQGSEHLRVL